MPFCPKCGYEYEPEVAVCPDCAVELVPEPISMRLARTPRYFSLSVLGQWAAVVLITFFAVFALYVAATIAGGKQSLAFNVVWSLYFLGAWFWFGYLLRNFPPRVLLLGLGIPAGYWLYVSLFGGHHHWRQLLFWSFALPGLSAATMFCGMSFGRKPHAAYAILPLLCVAVVAYWYTMLVQPLIPRVP